MIINDFLEYLKTEKKTAENTVEAYYRDLYAFDNFLKERFVNGLENAILTKDL